MPKATPCYGARFRKRKQVAETHRGSAGERGYGHAWRRYRELYLAQHPICAGCNDIATVVDHVTPVNWGGSFWDSANHQPLCRQCHQRKTAQERRDERMSR